MKYFQNPGGENNGPIDLKQSPSFPDISLLTCSEQGQFHFLDLLFEMDPAVSRIQVERAVDVMC